jgi:uncharacterized BrkB/YihY/UPF0761 family membrane protein
MGVNPQEKQLASIQHHFILDILWEVVDHENIGRVRGILGVLYLTILFVCILALAQVIFLKLFPTFLIKDSPIQANEYNHFFVESLSNVLRNIYKEQRQDPITVCPGV